MAEVGHFRQLLNLGTGIPVLVCEGKSDLVFLQQLFKTHASEIYLVPSEGKDAIAILCNSLQPAYYIRDRDADISLETAINSLKIGRGTAWSHRDIESYLLYTDWLWETLNSLQQASTVVIEKMPSSLPEIQASLTEAAISLAPSHAGQDVIARLKSQLNPGDFNPSFNLSIIDPTQCEQQILKEAERLRNKAQSNELLQVLELVSLKEQFAKAYEQYKAWGKDLQTVRIHFSGKRILRYITSLWKIRFSKKNLSPIQAGLGKANWQQFSARLQEAAITYAHNLSSLDKLCDDPRLGDFGLLASKILGRNN